MNGEISALVDQRTDAIAVPNDALKTTREGASLAPMLGLNSDSVTAQIRAQSGGGGGGGRGRGGNGPGTGGRITVQQGEVDLAPQQGAQQQGGQRRGGGMPQVTDKDCATVDAAYKKHPKEKKQLDDLMVTARDPGTDRKALQAKTQPLYATIGVDSKMAGACRRRESPGGGGGQFAGGRGGNGGGGRANGGAAAAADQAPRARPRPALVFVAEGASYVPRVVMLGAANLDYSEVVSGLKEGDKVVLLNVLALQAARQQQQDRARNNASPLGAPAGGAPRGGGAPGGGGGGRGGF